MFKGGGGHLDRPHPNQQPRLEAPQERRQRRGCLGVRLPQGRPSPGSPGPHRGHPPGLWWPNTCPRGTVVHGGPVVDMGPSDPSPLGLQGLRGLLDGFTVIHVNSADID